MDTHPTLPQDLWDQTPPEVRAYIETLEGQVQTLTSMIHTLQEQVRALQEQVTQTSRNSSRPPSSDPPQSPRPPRPRSQRRRGGQPGHRGQTRTLVPVDEVDQVVVLKPEQCSGCQGFVANFAQKVEKGQLPLTVKGLSSQGVEQLGRSEAFVFSLHDHLSFLDHVHELNPNECVLSGLERFKPQHGSCHPLYASMILLHNVVEILDLTDGDRGAVLSIVARACSHFSGQVPSRARCEVAIRFNMFHRPAL